MLWFNNKSIAIFISQKSDGDMLFKNTLINADSELINADKINDKVRANRISFFKKHNIDPNRFVNLAGIHGTHIAMTCHSDMGRGALDVDTRIPETDGLITNIRNSYLMITGADCFPVMFFDEKKGAIGAAHAGWRGIIKGIIPEMVLKFKSDFGSNPADINAWVGPGIKSCHYLINKERAELFSKNYKNHIIEREHANSAPSHSLRSHFGNPKAPIRITKIFLDLAGVIKSQLTASGINSQKITEHPDCTFCEKDKWFSYRRDKTKIIKANAFIINLK